MELTTIRMVLMAVIAGMSLMARMTDSQPPPPPPPCVAQLQPCLYALKDPSAKPSTQCCAAVTLSVREELSCVCDLVYNSTFQKAMPNFNATRALEIASECGIQDLGVKCGQYGPAPASAPSSGEGNTGAAAPPPSSKDKNSSVHHPTSRLSAWLPLLVLLISIKF